MNNERKMEHSLRPIVTVTASNKQQPYGKMKKGPGRLAMAVSHFITMDSVENTHSSVYTTAWAHSHIYS